MYTIAEVVCAAESQQFTFDSISVDCDLWYNIAKVVCVAESQQSAFDFISIDYDL